MSQIKRTSQGLRETLFEELDNLKNGISNPQRANAVSKTAAQIINSVKLELDYSKHLASMSKLGTTPNERVPFVQLGEK